MPHSGSDTPHSHHQGGTGTSPKAHHSFATGQIRCLGELWVHKREYLHLILIPYHIHLLKLDTPVVTPGSCLEHHTAQVVVVPSQWVRHLQQPLRLVSILTAVPIAHSLSSQRGL